MSEPQEPLEPWMPWALFGITAIVHLPILIWIGRETQAHEQLLQSMLILVTASILLFFRNKNVASFQHNFNNEVIYLLGASYLLGGLNLFIQFGVLSLGSICLAFLAFGLFLFGSRERRLVYGLFCAFFIFTLLIIFLPSADWPLRIIAAKSSQFLFSLIGQETELTLIRLKDEFQLLINRGGQSFYVAPECNGYGILSASLLCSICLAITYKIRWLTGILSVAVTLALAVLANSIRIVAIILLAPVVGISRYDLMHEAVGLGVLLSYLVLIWWAFEKLNSTSQKSPT